MSSSDGFKFRLDLAETIERLDETAERLRNEMIAEIARQKSGSRNQSQYAGDTPKDPTAIYGEAPQQKKQAE